MEEKNIYLNLDFDCNSDWVFRLINFEYLKEYYEKNIF